MQKNETGLVIHPFALEVKDALAMNRDFLESVFSLGNGYMGVRGYDSFSQGRKPYERSIFIAGLFEYIRSGITDMVNTPDIFHAAFLEPMTQKKARLHLDMQTGLLTREAVWADACGRHVECVTQRFISMDDPHLAGQRITLRPLDAQMHLALDTGINGDVANLPISDDQMASNGLVLRLLSPGDVRADAQGGSLVMHTTPSNRSVYQAYTIETNRPVLKKALAQDGFSGVRLSAALSKGESLRIDKLIATYTYRDGEADPLDAAQKAAAGVSFDAAFEKSLNAFKALWENADIVVDADGDLQGAMRFNLFQLMQNNAARDEKASIGARGLMHGRYKGNYFWDTEIFMLPFYLYTRPEAAKNLLMYRYHTLEDAMEGARRFGLRGARYPWMCSDTGFEQCETWDTGCCEVHITADVAYAVWQYCQVTGDFPFLRDHGARILIETARYWQSRMTRDPATGMYHLLFVKGPDEYCGVTVDNTYTNMLVQENLRYAYQAAETLKQDAPEAYRALNTDEAELKSFLDMAEQITLLYDPSRALYLQDAHFEQMEPIDISLYKKDHAALYRTMSFDRLQRLKVLKQADLVLLCALLPERFSDAQMQNIFHYYEPLTLHDSTLSFGVHAWQAAKIGERPKAMDYFLKSAYLDLHNIMDNTQNEGIHMASLGATWQALIFGMAGLHIGKDGTPALKPNLPVGIRSLEATVQIKHESYRLAIKGGMAKIERAEKPCDSAADAVQ